MMLSDFARVKPGEKVLDLGTGTGILPILLSAKTRGEHFIGLEIQKESADMARRSIEWNHLQEKIEIVQGDIKEAAALFKPTFFDVIVTNPPYMLNQHGLQNPGDAKAIARHEILCTLDDILRESKQLLADGKGRFYMIHKPFRLGEILTKMSEYKIEPKRIRFVHPYIDKEPTMVLIEGLRGGKPRVRVRERKQHDRNVIFVCNSNRKSGGYDFSCDPYTQRSGSDRSGGYKKQYQAVKSF